MLNKLAQILEDELKNELLQQGHTATGDLYNSIKVSATDFEITGTSVFYGQYVNRGRNKGVKGVPIEALIKWIEDKRFEFKDDAEKRSIAFAIQRKIINEGIPTKNSFDHTKNGRRKEWINYTLESNKFKITEFINKYIGDKLETILFNYVKEAGKTEIVLWQ